MYSDLKNKNVLIIGGSGLIGTEITKKFEQNQSYIYNLDLIDNNKETLYSNYKFIKFDISQNSKLEKKFNLLLNQISPDVVINCSYPISKGWAKYNFDEVKLEFISSNIEAHLVSYIWSSILALRYLKKNKKYSSLILFGSTYGLRGQDLRIYKGTKMRENSIYSAIKGGIVNFTRQAASFYGQFGVRVNCVCPDYMVILKVELSQPKSFLKKYSERTPLRRLGYAYEIADGVLYLSSKQSSYISGSVFEIDGGWTSV